MDTPVLDPPATEAELAYVKGPGSNCGCTGRCKQGPHYTCGGTPREEQIAWGVLFLRKHHEVLLQNRPEWRERLGYLPAGRPRPQG